MKNKVCIASLTPTGIWFSFNLDLVHEIDLHKIRLIRLDSLTVTNTYMLQRTICTTCNHLLLPTPTLAFPPPLVTPSYPQKVPTSQPPAIH